MHRFLRIIVFAALASGATVTDGSAQGNSGAMVPDSIVAEAERVAQQFLAHVDSAQWSAAHALMVPMMRSAIEPQDLHDMVVQARGASAAGGARRRVLFEPAATPAGAGVTLVYEVTGAVRRSETLTLARTGEGFRVVSYGIR